MIHESDLTIESQDASKLKGYCLIDNIPDTAIQRSDLHGLGLFSLKNLMAGVKLCDLDGQIVSYDLYDSQMRKPDYSKQVVDNLFVEWNALPNNMLLARMFRTKYSYINHSRTPNCKLIGYPPKLWSIADIETGEELTIDYREEPLPDLYKHGHGSTYL